jgi:hypothetical protein
MISYQEYNTKSPLNGLAAKWAAQNSQLLPVDPRPIAPPLEQPPTEAIAAPPPPPTPHAAAPLAQPAAPAASPTAAASASPVSGEEDPWNQKIVIS